MENVPTWIISVTTVIAAIGGKELLVLIVKNWQKRKDSPDKTQLREDRLIAENSEILHEVLADLKNQLKEKNQIESDLREKYINVMNDNSACRATLEMLLKDIQK